MKSLWTFVEPDVDNATITLKADNSFTTISTRATHPENRLGYRADFPDNHPNGHGCRRIIAVPGKLVVNQKGILLFNDGVNFKLPVDAVLAVDDVTLEDIPVPPKPTEPEEPGTLPPGVVPGCNGGILTDWKAYVLHVLSVKAGRPIREGDDARIGPKKHPGDFEDILQGTFPPGPARGLHSNPKVHFGITQQIGAGGRIAGRLWLPSDIEDGNRDPENGQPTTVGYYTVIVDILADKGRPDGLDGLVWKLNIASGQRSRYAPRPC